MNSQIKCTFVVSALALFGAGVGVAHARAVDAAQAAQAAQTAATQAAQAAEAAQTAHTAQQAAQAAQQAAQAAQAAAAQAAKAAQAAQAAQAAATQAEAVRPPQPQQAVRSPSKLQVHLGGRIQYDTAAFFSRNTTAASGKMGNGTHFAAVRLRAEGKYGDDWSFQVQYDFTDSGAQGIKFAYLEYDGFKNQAIRIGNQFEQFGLENRIPSNYLTFIGQSPAFAAIGVGPRHLGVSYTRLDGPFHLGVGVYGPVPGYQPASTLGSQGIDVATRLLFDPVAKPGELLHFGVSARYHHYGSANTDIGTHNDSVLATHAFSPLSDLFPILIAARAPGSKPDYMMNYNAEFAGTFHSLNLQGEYYWTKISGLRGLSSPNATFKGYYGQISYFLTGESRRFIRTPFYDIFVGTKPLHPIDQGGIGSWEIAARYSMADLNSGAITGGKERDITFGLNWTPVYHLRFMLDLVRVLPIEQGRNNGASFDAVDLRSEVFF